MTRPTRRQFVQGAVATGATLSFGCADTSDHATHPECPDPFSGGERVATLPFLEEQDVAFHTPLRHGLAGRLYTDLSELTLENMVTPNEKFFIRTRAPARLDSKSSWTIKVRGGVRNEIDWTLDELQPRVRPKGVYLVDCAGNYRGGHFGLISAAAWSGVAIHEILQGVQVDPKAPRVLVSGVDDLAPPSRGGYATRAGWIFTVDQLETAGAFLATEMNGVPLSVDHGFPVRLVIPGWYGPTCIKWVNEIRFLPDDAPATPLMQEYAWRTHQHGTPELARDYRPATVDQSAMPVRVEQWRVGGRTCYKVTGILWGGDRITDALVIRFNPDEDWVPVQVCPKQTTNRTWTLWSHRWTPTAPGVYKIQLQVNDPTVRTRRLDKGVYVRAVEVKTV